MDRRTCIRGLATLAATGWGAPQAAHAQSLADLTHADAVAALRSALEKGALAAIGSLGVTDGFLGNARVRIGLPGRLADAEKLLRTLGQGDRVDELVLAMNRAAEQAVPLARDPMVGAVRNMSVADAKGILTGGNTAATDYFSAHTRPALSEKFLPVVTRATEHVGLADKYNQVAGKAADMGLMSKDDANVQQYVTGKALDGLFLLIADEEQKIRAHPAEAGSALLRKVFGAL